MVIETENVLVRVEPDVKKQAEAIMAKLGISASTVINMLYGQIVLTESIPSFLSIPNALIARDEMDSAAFDSMMSERLAQAKAGQGVPVDEAFNFLHGDIHGKKSKKYCLSYHFAKCCT